MRQLVNGLRFLGNWRYDWTVPSTSALSQARTRLGEAPLKLLCERIAVPMARAGTRGAWVHGLTVMALDGLVFDVPDTPANDEAFAPWRQRPGQGSLSWRCALSRWPNAVPMPSSTLY